MFEMPTLFFLVLRLLPMFMWFYRAHLANGCVMHVQRARHTHEYTHIPPHGFSKEYLVFDASHTKVHASLCYFFLVWVLSTLQAEVPSMGPTFLCSDTEKLSKVVGGAGTSAEICSLRLVSDTRILSPQLMSIHR